MLAQENQSQKRKCKDCSEEKSLEHFNSDCRPRKSTGLCGYKHYCKNCESIRNSLKKKYPRSKEQRNADARKYREKHLASYRANRNKRKARVKQATPDWVDRGALRDIYLAAQMEGKVVDHQIPIHSEVVCGLHVPWNLQLLTNSDNCRKSNKVNLGD